MGLIRLITPRSGWETERLMMPFSFRNNSVRFFICGMTRGIQRPLRVRTRQKSKPKKSKALASLQIDDPTLFFVDFHSQLAELLPESFLHRVEEPPMTRMRVHHDDQVVCKADVLDLLSISQNA